MQLEQKPGPEGGSQRERLLNRSKLWSALIALVAVVYPILASHVFGSPVPFDKDATVLSIAAGAIYTIAIAVFFVGLAANCWNLSRFRRARKGLQRKRFESCAAKLPTYGNSSRAT